MFGREIRMLLRHYLEQGTSKSALARHLGVHRDTIHRWIRDGELDRDLDRVPSRWAGLDLVVRIGATAVTIVGKDGTRIRHPRKRFGQRSIDYRHYLPELARKPQAVRQVLPDLLRDLGAPFPAVWDHLHAAHGPREAARLFAKISVSWRRAVRATSSRCSTRRSQ